MHRLADPLRTAAAAALTLALFAAPGTSQVSPNLEWRTLHGDHFRVHFSPGLEQLARTSLAYAEVAYVRLARELKAPRGRVDIVVADNRDFANGYASTFPTNRIVVYATPPTATPMLRGANDWLEMLITHELVHIFHLDRSEGLWRLPRIVFGRNPSMMPNNYAPTWLKEGLAVFYESKLTGAGRLASGEFLMIPRADAEANDLPGVGDFSLVTSRIPEGHTPYVYGSHLIQYLADKAGHDKMEGFVKSMSSLLIPYLTSSSASRELGSSFGAAWKEFGDSLVDAYGAGTVPLEGWRVLTTGERLTWYPRWLDSDDLLYVRSDGRSTPGLYSLSLQNGSRRIARRNAVGVNAPAPNGAVVFSQPEYSDPYVIRSDLYMRTREGVESRLTRGARLTAPDVRADGEIVAVRGGAGSSEIVRVSPDASSIRAVVAGVPGEYWADPRWSPDGLQIAAVRRDSGGINSLVVLQETGSVTTLVQSRAMIAAPSWLDADRILFQRDSGRSQIALAVRSGGFVDVYDVTRSSTGMLQPEPSPSGSAGTRKVAIVQYRLDGYRLGWAPLPLQRIAAQNLPPANPYSPGEAAAAAALASVTIADTITSRKYSALRFMLPRYWVPIAGKAANDRSVVGGSTSAYDLVDRHSYDAQLLLNSGDGSLDGHFDYTYAGLVNPRLTFGVAQAVDHVGIFGGTPRSRLGFLREWSRSAALSAQFSRPRYRSSAAFAFGADFERITFDSDPAELLGQVENFNAAARDFVSVAAGFAWSNTRRPSLSISPEDGFSVSLSARERWRMLTSATPVTTLTGTLRGFKAINLPGFAHHVLAGRLSMGMSSASATTRFGVGGTSGSRLELFPGYAIGDVSRTFSVRGFEPSTLVGLRAIGGSVEYRAPIAMPSQGWGMFPLFFDRISFSLFADIGAAWCPDGYSGRALCEGIPGSSRDNMIASAGGELNFDTALMYDSPYRLRLGIANIVHKPDNVVARRNEVYFSLGFPF